MSNASQPLFFDETGFTDNHLLDPEQPVFVYAGISLDEQAAKDLQLRALSLLSASTRELKGRNLLRSRSGRHAAEWLLVETREYASFMWVDKKYALAGKFFEYVFEPPLARNSALLYDIDFHRFIAMILYVSFDNEADGKVLEAFASIMRSQDARHIDPLLVISSLSSLSWPVKRILDFACCHRKSVEESLLAIHQLGGIRRWILDLSATSLHCLLAYWGQQYDSLRVYCDASMPIQEWSPIFSVFQNRKDNLYLKIGSREAYPMTYNLADPIELVDSVDSPGVQIADVLASCLSFALRRPQESISKEWISIMNSSIVNVLEPDLRQLDLGEMQPFVNATVLSELADRSVNMRDILSGLEEVIWRARLSYDHRRL